MEKYYFPSLIMYNIYFLLSVHVLQAMGINVWNSFKQPSILKADTGSGDARGRDMQGHSYLCGDFKRDRAGAPHSIPAEMVLWDLASPSVRAGNLSEVGWLGSGSVLGLHHRPLAPHWDCIMCSLNPNAAGFSRLYSSKMPAHNPARDSL